MSSSLLVFPFPEPPRPLALIEVSSGIFWMRLPLPFRLDHVNVYLIEDGDGYALIDTGIDDETTRALWEAIFAGALLNKRITRVIATHWHPDHIGLAGWIAQRFGAKLHATQSEYLDTLALRLDPQSLQGEPYRSFYISHGLSVEVVDLMLNRGLHYLSMVSQLPRTFRRIVAGETLTIGRRRFEVLTGGGHSSEMAMLWCPAQNVFLSADQVLAKISPNISVEAIDPDGDPLGLYLRSLEALKNTIGDSALVLPGHNLPFLGLAARVQELEAHHAGRCKAILFACQSGPKSTFDLIPVVFGRQLEDPHQLSFAFGEALAHANYLVRQEQLVVLDGGGGQRFALPEN